MILFETFHLKTYNYIIHNFLEVEVFNDETDLGDIIEMIIPKYLYREQYSKCVKVFQELYYWTGDTFYHQMSSFHELILYKFIDYMEDLQNEFDEFNQIYFNKKCQLLIKEASEIDFNNNGELNLKECEDIFYDVSYYTDRLFSDIDFLLVDQLYNNRKFGESYAERVLGINIDYYFELLPIDIDMSTLFWTYFYRTIYLKVCEFICNNNIASLALSRVK